MWKWWTMINKKNWMDCGGKINKIEYGRWNEWDRWIWTFGWLVHQINSLYKDLKLKQNFPKKVVTGKTLFFVLGLFYTPHSNWLLTKYFCMGMLRFQSYVFLLEIGTRFLWKGFAFFWKLVSKSKYW